MMTDKAQMMIDEAQRRIVDCLAALDTAANALETIYAAGIREIDMEGKTEAISDILDMLRMTMEESTWEIEEDPSDKSEEQTVFFAPPVVTFAPPKWATEYLDKLKAIVQCNTDIVLRTVLPESFDGHRIGVTDNPDGYTCLSDPPMIVIRHDLGDCDRSRNLLCHEFIHALHGNIDRFAIKCTDDEQTYRYAVMLEEFVNQVSMVMRMADFVNATFVDVKEEDNE